jgi:hypothetical protein
MAGPIGLNPRRTCEGSETAEGRMALLVGVVRTRRNQKKEAKLGFGRKEENRRCDVSPGIVQRGYGTGKERERERAREREGKDFLWQI